MRRLEEETDGEGGEGVGGVGGLVIFIKHAGEKYDVCMQAMFFVIILMIIVLITMAPDLISLNVYIVDQSE